jgi:hypothetical protein
MLKQLETWFKVNNLIINIKKHQPCHSILRKVGVIIDPIYIYYNSITILYSDKVTFLDLDITENLNWKNHIQVVCAKLSKTILIIKLLKGVLSVNLLRSTYFGKFQSLLRYRIIFWGGAGDSSKVLKIQKRVLRIMNGKDKQESCRPIFKENGILTVMSLYILEAISYIKKHKADLIQNINIHNHNTRLNKDYHVNYCRMSLFKRSVINKGIELYSKVPNKIKKTWKVFQFLRELKSSFIKSCLLYNR